MLHLTSGLWEAGTACCMPETPFFHKFTNLLNSAEEYCGPLSLLTSSGIPCLGKIAFSALMTSLGPG